MARYEDFHVARLRVGDPADEWTANAAGASFTIGSESSNTINVSVQLTDALGDNLERANAVMAYLSSDASGQVIEAADTALSVALGTNGVFSELAADNTFMLVTEATGVVDIDITDTRVNTVYLNVILPSGKIVTSGAITFA